MSRRWKRSLNTTRREEAQGQRRSLSRPMLPNECGAVVELWFTCSRLVIVFWCWQSSVTSTSSGRLRFCAHVRRLIDSNLVHRNEFPVGLVSDFNLESDFMGTFMTVATSFPELLVSCVGTFVTENGDIGVGTIVGSAVFNILAVPAFCGLFARTSIQLEKQSVSRDCIFYGFSIFAFIAVIYDNRIMWYEAGCLVAFYGIYLACNVYFRNHLLRGNEIFPLSRHVQQRKDGGEVGNVFQSSSKAAPSWSVSRSLWVHAALQPWKFIKREERRRCRVEWTTRKDWRGWALCDKPLENCKRLKQDVLLHTLAHNVHALVHRSRLATIQRLLHLHLRHLRLMDRLHFIFRRLHLNECWWVFLIEDSRVEDLTLLDSQIL